MMVDKEVIDTMLRMLAYLSGRIEQATRVKDRYYLTGQRDCTKHIIDLLTE